MQPEIQNKRYFLLALRLRSSCPTVSGSSLIQLPSTPIEAVRIINSLQYLYWKRLSTIKPFFLKIECIEYKNLNLNLNLNKPITTVQCSNEITVTQ